MRAYPSLIRLDRVDHDQTSSSERSTTQVEASDRVRVGGIVFDPVTGEICAVEPKQGEEPRRLAPQPAKLLSLLIAHHGELVDQQQIREHLWPEVKADVDQNLHFCVRQVRAALEDSASVPRYIETLPRRGYRLMAEVEPWSVDPVSEKPELGDESAAELLPAASPQAESYNTRRVWTALAAGAVVGLILALGWTRGRSQPVASPPVIAEVSLAITSFQPETFSSPVQVPQIINHLLARLGGFDPSRLGVIGPTTTAPYGTDLRRVHRMITELDVDYVINGRWSGGPPDPKLLIEVIRASDGHHVWVQQFEDLTQWQRIADLVADAVLEIVGPVTASHSHGS